MEIKDKCLDCDKKIVPKKAIVIDITAGLAEVIDKYEDGTDVLGCEQSSGTSLYLCFDCIKNKAKK